ncbi:hypothetical protein BKA80DRAFT_319270, partial [Phyllosticta citrichinensis]
MPSPNRLPACLPGTLAISELRSVRPSALAAALQIPASQVVLQPVIVAGTPQLKLLHLPSAPGQGVLRTDDDRAWHCYLLLLLRVCSMRRSPAQFRLLASAWHCCHCRPGAFPTSCSLCACLYQLSHSLTIRTIAASPLAFSDQAETRSGQHSASSPLRRNQPLRPALLQHMKQNA